MDYFRSITVNISSSGSISLINSLYGKQRIDSGNEKKQGSCLLRLTRSDFRKCDILRVCHLFSDPFNDRHHRRADKAVLQGQRENLIEPPSVGVRIFTAGFRPFSINRTIMITAQERARHRFKNKIIIFVLDQVQINEPGRFDL